MIYTTKEQLERARALAMLALRGAGHRPAVKAHYDLAAGTVSVVCLRAGCWAGATANNLELVVRPPRRRGKGRHE